jgi:hypothetical protein
MTKPTRGRVQKESPPAGWLVHTAMLIAFLAVSLASGFVWLVPIEVFETWAVDRAVSGKYGQPEAVGEADFMVWLCRIVTPLLLAWIWRVWSNVGPWRLFVADLWSGLATITRSTTRPDSTCLRSRTDFIRTVGCRGLLLAWGVVFIAHGVHAIGQRAHDWPYFQFYSGEVVLPNISESNRALIWYVQQSTPKTARILVASDQKLFFLSYYLRPRTLLHRMHPESEHVIPLNDQQRKLAAYRLEELTPADLARMPHDFTLEYFEHPDLVDRSQVLSDPVWVAYVRQWEENPSLIPSCMVRLRKAEER